MYTELQTNNWGAPWQKNELWNWSSIDFIIIYAIIVIIRWFEHGYSRYVRSLTVNCTRMYQCFVIGQLGPLNHFDHPVWGDRLFQCVLFIIIIITISRLRDRSFFLRIHKLSVYFRIETGRTTRLNRLPYLWRASIYGRGSTLWSPDMVLVDAVFSAIDRCFR